MPADRLLIETDCPPTGPGAAARRRTKPALHHKHAGEAQSCGKFRQHMAEQLYENALRIFGLRDEPEEIPWKNLTAHRAILLFGVVRGMCWPSHEPDRQELEQALDELRGHLALENRASSSTASGETVFLHLPDTRPGELFFAAIQKQPLSQAGSPSIIAYRQPVTKGDLWRACAAVKCDTPCRRW